MDNPGEILRLCRLCLVKDQVNIPIFEEQGDIKQTFLKIRSCLPVKVSRDDKLPKKICGGCSNKLDLFYEFWSSTANSEKTLQSWLGQEEEDDKMQEITKPVEALVKEESEALEDGHAHDQSFDEATKDEAEAPPAKRARRTAAVKAQINISHDSDEDEDVDGAEPITKIEDESDESDGEEKDPSYTEVPGTSADDQAGPSGLGKDGVEAPSNAKRKRQSLMECFTCQLPFASKLKLNQHLFTHNNSSRPFKCPICRKIFKTNSSLAFHIKNIHSSPRGFKCEICAKVVSNERYFHLHTQAHKSDFGFFCQHCGKGFVYKHQCKLHMETMHSSSCKNFVCDICGKEFSIASYLRRHQIRHGASTEPKTECKICKKPYVRIQRHYKEQHSAQSALYMCHLCGQKFKQSFELKLHMMRHKGEKPHRCSYEGCFKSFVRKQHLLLHMRSHTGEKPFVCAVCGNRYTQKPSLVIHMRGHLGEKPYECDLCWSKFASKQRLNIHKRKVHKLVGDGRKKIEV